MIQVLEDDQPTNSVHIMTLLFSALLYSCGFFSDETVATGRSKSILHQFDSISQAGVPLS